MSGGPAPCGPTPGGLTPGGPKVVAVGGGHGQAVTLRAARRYAGELTAVVTVADDGGSTGRLRRELGIVAPGDLRTCLVALAAPASTLARAFDHRFAGIGWRGAAPGPGEVRGHALGNLVLAGLMDVTGDVQAAVDEAAALLGAVGRVVPATYASVVLAADTAGGAVEGQVAVMHSPHIRRVSLVPPDPPAAAAAVAAIEAADQVVLGPGSLYTSVLAAAAVPGVADALRRTAARRVYVCNLRPQAVETEGYDVAAHVAALAAHGVPVDVVLCDTSGIALGQLPVPVVDVPLCRPNGLAHDADRLAEFLVDLLR